MAFLILTHHGYLDLIRERDRLPSPLWMNPGILPDEEIRRLREDGVQLTLLDDPVDPLSMSDIETAVGRMQEAGLTPVWVERISPGKQPDGSLSSLPDIFAESAESADSAVPDSVPPTAGRSFNLRRKASALYGRTLHYIKRASAADGPVIIVPYMSYGTSQQLQVRGRVLQNKGFGVPDPGHGALTNFIEFYKQLGSDEVPGARVVARVDGIEQEITADRGGYFQAELELSAPIKNSGWIEVKLELLHPVSRNDKRSQATARVLIPSLSARFGVISDIDDTVLWSNVGNKLRMLTMLAVSNAHTRKPFKGVTAFYGALQQGASGNEDNPIFYVSSSPWHLYTQLVDFFEAQGIPVGPLALKELGIKALFGSSRHHDHKLANIDRILQTYPHLPFILIGDSGQQDPEIYKEVVERHPDRILAIYIRNVNPDPARVAAIDRLIDEVKASDTQLLLVPDSEFAAMHAAGEGWINADVLNTVRSDKRDDERLTNPKI